MEILRSTLWKAPGNRTHVVVRASDVHSIEETMHHPSLDMLVTHERFEMADDVTLEDATIEAGWRFTNREKTERHMAIMYYYGVRILSQLAPTRLVRGLMASGAWAVPDPTPLELDDLKKTLAALAVHSAYEGQTITAMAQDHTLAILDKGIVTTEDAPA